MKVFPVSKIRKLIDEISDTMAAHPQATHTFIIRGSYVAGSEGGVGVELSADAPLVEGVVDAKLGVGYSRRWDDVGNGEWVYRVEYTPK